MTPAVDGSGNNSPYAKYLFQSIDAPNLDIEDTFKRTLKGVYMETKGEQTPVTPVLQGVPDFAIAEVRRQQ